MRCKTDETPAKSDRHHSAQFLPSAVRRRARTRRAAPAKQTKSKVKSISDSELREEWSEPFDESIALLSLVKIGVGKHKPTWRYQSAATPGATIYYTTDGTAPTAGSSMYKAPFGVLSSETVEAIAIGDKYSPSPVAVASYTIDHPQAAAPNFSVPPGTYTSTQMVTLSDATTGAAIYYTTDGTAPTTAAAVYGGAITVSTTETLQAIAVAGGYTNSAVASAAYVINIGPPPTFTLQASPASLTVSSGSQGTVTLTVTPKYGFNSNVSFACSGLPAGSACSFSPSSITPSGASATSVLTISTNSQSAAAWGANSPSYLRVMTLALTVFLFRWRCPKLQQRPLLALALIGLGLASDCGGTGTENGNGGGGSASVTSTVTITATAGKVQQTILVCLTVDQRKTLSKWAVEILLHPYRTQFSMSL